MFHTRWISWVYNKSCFDTSQKINVWKLCQTSSVFLNFWWTMLAIQICFQIHTKNPNTDESFPSNISQFSHVRISESVHLVGMESPQSSNQFVLGTEAMPFGTFSSELLSTSPSERLDFRLVSCLFRCKITLSFFEGAVIEKNYSLMNLLKHSGERERSSRLQVSSFWICIHWILPQGKKLILRHFQFSWGKWSRFTSAELLLAGARCRWHEYRSENRRPFTRVDIYHWSSKHPRRQFSRRFPHISKVYTVLKRDPNPDHEFRALSS